jgi:hypothetical protein
MDKLGIVLWISFVIAGSVLGAVIHDSLSQIACDSYILNTLNLKGITVNDDGIIRSPSLVIRVASFSEFQAVCKRLNSTTVYYYVASGVAAYFPYDGYYVFNKDLQIAYVFFSDVNNWTGAWSIDSG